MAATVLEPQKKKTRLMTEGSIWKSILLFSVPLILGNLLQQLYNTADSARMRSGPCTPRWRWPCFWASS